MKKIKIDYCLLAMLLGIALIRLIFFWGASFDWQRAIIPDSSGYLRLARNILENGVFSSYLYPPYIPDTFRTPLYPLFLASIMGVFGKNNYAAIIVFQLVISLLIGMLIYRTVLVLFGRRNAYFVGWLYAFDLPSSAHTVYIHTETLFTILLFLSFITLFHFIKSGGSRFSYLYISGLSAGLVALCRPIAVYFFIPAVMIILVGSYSTKFLRRLKYAGSWLLIFFILVGGWVIRNSLVTGVPSFSDIQGEHLLFQASHAAAQAEGVPFSKNFTDAFKGRLPEELTDEKFSFGERDKYFRRYALEIIRKHPGDFLIVELMGVGTLLFSPGRNTVGRLLGLAPLEASTNVLGTFSFQEVKRAFRMIFISTSRLLWIAGINWIYLIMVYALAFCGIIFLYQHKRSLLFALLTVLFYLILLSSGPGSDSRLRVPMMPYILILAGAGSCKIRGIK